MARIVPATIMANGYVAYAAFRANRLEGIMSKQAQGLGMNEVSHIAKCEHCGHEWDVDRFVSNCPSEKCQQRFSQRISVRPAIPSSEDELPPLDVTTLEEMRKCSTSEMGTINRTQIALHARENQLRETLAALRKVEAERDGYKSKIIDFHETLRNIAVDGLGYPDPWGDEDEPTGEWLGDGTLSGEVKNLRKAKHAAESANAELKEWLGSLRELEQILKKHISLFCQDCKNNQIWGHKKECKLAANMRSQQKGTL